MIVKAKRMGWDEVLTPEQQLDMEPLEADDVDLEGELEFRKVTATEEHDEFTLTLVDGQEADPKTVVPV